MTELVSQAGVQSVPQGNAAGRISRVPRAARLAQFIAVSFQLGLLLLLLRLFEIEPGSGLTRILPLVFGGFIVHAALPMRSRLPFFLLLSITAIGLAVGPIPGAILVVLALAIIGTCHLPIAFSMRVLLILLIGIALAAMRAGWIAIPRIVTSTLQVPSLGRAVLPVLGSMFMFRLIIYLYELRHEEKAPNGNAVRSGMPATIWTRLSYFLLLPNACFLLFPVVDFRTYRRTYYDSDAQSIYQKGVWLMFLGLVYLLAYRLVYHYLVPSAEEVQGLVGIARFMTSAYLIYFRVVGQFHLIIGMLCLFGFNLPPAFRYFLLASSFTDFWRRARIEWKDFMVKIFYYPLLVPSQRKWGATAALVLGTISVFVATWLLHAYQWFWLRGDLRFSQTDMVFWGIIGSCVLLNSLLEARRGRAPRTTKVVGWSVGPAALHAIKVVGIFAFMCVLWSYWSSPSLKIWLSYLTAARDSSIDSYAFLALGLAVAVAVGVVVQFVAARLKEARPVPANRARVQKPDVFWRPATVLMAATVLLLLRVPVTRGELAASVQKVVATVSSNRLNSVDQERQDRGYYEVLLDEPRSTVLLLAAEGVQDSQETQAAEGDGVEQGESTGELGDVAGAASAASAAAIPTDGKSEGTVALDAAPHPSDIPLVKHGTTNKDTVIRTPAKKSVNASVNDAAAATPASTVTAQRPDQPDTTIPAFAGRRLRPYERFTRGPTMWENVPGYSGSFKGAPVDINQWGMRDKEYTLVPPPHTYRMALLGTSMTVGAGVPVEQTMETLLENRLNREGPGTPRRHYEILNFSVGAYGIMQNVALAEQKVFNFAPNAILVGVFSVDAGRMTTYLAKLVKSNYPIPWPYVRQKLNEVGANSTMQPPELQRRIAPISEEMVRWSYQRILEIGRQKGVPVLGIVLPEPSQLIGHDINQAARLAASAGLPLLDLRGVYDGLPVDSLHLSEDDPHWNARGHKLIADRIYELLGQNDSHILKLGFKDNNSPPNQP